MADINSLEKDISTTSLGNNILQSPDTKNNKNKPSTSAEKSDISHNDSLAPSSDQIEKFEIGDIVWAKIGKYPFWPSIVCIDPVTKINMRGSSLDGKNKFFLHVRFCNDNGRSSWAKTVESYSGKDDLLTKYPKCLDLIKNKKQMEIWTSAIKEADELLKFDRKERWVNFSNLYKLLSPNQSVSNNSGIATKGKITEGSNHNASNSLKIYSKEMSIGEVTDEDEKSDENEDVSVEEVPDEDFKKKMIVKKNIEEIEDEEITPLIDISFSTSVPEIDYHINDVENIPGTTRWKVDEQIRRDIIKLEAEGIRKVKEWKALQLAKTAETAKFDL